MERSSGPRKRAFNLSDSIRQRLNVCGLAVVVAGVSVLAFSFMLTAFARTASNPVPLIDQPLFPETAAPGSGAFTLTVRGTGFVSSSVVNWNGTALATTFVNGVQLSATVPAANVASPETASVTVTNRGPGGGVSNTVFFLVIGRTPTVVMPEKDFPLREPPLYLLAADLNHDGKMDLATLSYVNNTVSILLGNGDGTFQSPVDYAEGDEKHEAQWMTMGDFDNDGNLDLAVCTGNGIGSGTVYLLFGNGDGTFQQPTTSFPANGSAAVIASGDFNGDGNLDLIIGYDSGDDGFVSVALGNGDGTFGSLVDYAAGRLNTSIVLGDFNNDGKIDIATSDTFGSDASLLLGVGDGTFHRPRVFSNQEFPQGITAADFNHDGNLDLALPVDFGVTVFLGHGDGTFGSGVNYACGSQPGTYSVSVGDFNGDGNLDLVLPCNGGVSILPGNGDGTFQSPIVQPVNVYVNALTVGDFNQDGRLDVALADDTTSAFSVLLQSTLVVSPTNVFFPGVHLVGTMTPPHEVKVENFGPTTVRLGKIAVVGSEAGDFPFHTTCGSRLSSGHSCIVRVAFKPTDKDRRFATLSIPNNTLGVAQSVSLSGIGTFVKLYPHGLNFGSVPVGHTSAPQRIKLTNTGSALLHILSIDIRGNNRLDFSQTNNCGPTVSAGGSCTITVTFTPTATGLRKAAVTVRDDGGGTQRAGLSGTGT